MEFQILGLLELADGPRSMELRGSKLRTLLAVLILHVYEVVSADALVEALWGDRAPDSAAHCGHPDFSASPTQPSPIPSSLPPFWPSHAPMEPASKTCPHRRSHYAATVSERGFKITAPRAMPHVVMHAHSGTPQPRSCASVSVDRSRSGS